MQLFCWHLDGKLSKSSGTIHPFNEFSFYHFIGDSQSSNGRPRSTIYIREEPGQLHYNVYNDNERLDVVPVLLFLDSCYL